MDDRRIMDSLWIVKSSAAYYRSRSKALPYDLLYQEGCVGLLEAAKRFNMEFDSSFSTFAAHRVRGAMRDAYRKEMQGGFSGLSRDIRRKDFSLPVPKCLNEPRFGLEFSTPILWEETLGSDGMLDRLCAKDLVERLLSMLEPRRRRIMELYHYEGYRMREIGELLGITESRVSQLVKEIRTYLTRKGEQNEELSI